ncbi:MAG: hypothetical protein Q4B04_05335 [bacterium]|nr:hypothetical protein [bacterium]
MEFKPEMFEVKLACEREEIARDFFDGTADESTMSRLYRNIAKSLICRPVQSSIFEVSRLVDSVLGAAVVLCAGKGILLETQLEGVAVVFDDMRLWELSLLTFIREVCEGFKGDCLKIVADFSGRIFRLQIVCEKVTTDFMYSQMLVSKIGGKIVETVSGLCRSVYLLIPINYDCAEFVHEDITQKNVYTYPCTAVEYLSDPFSIAYIALYSVCENPLFIPEWHSGVRNSKNNLIKNKKRTEI